MAQLTLLNVRIVQKQITSLDFCSGAGIAAYDSPVMKATLSQLHPSHQAMQGRPTKQQKSAAKLDVIRAVLTYTGCLPIAFPTYGEFIAILSHDKSRSTCIAALPWHTQFSAQSGEHDASAMSKVRMQNSWEKVSLFPFHPWYY